MFWLLHAALIWLHTPNLFLLRMPLGKTPSHKNLETWLVDSHMNNQVWVSVALIPCFNWRIQKPFCRTFECWGGFYGLKHAKLSQKWDHCPSHQPVYSPASIFPVLSGQTHWGCEANMSCCHRVTPWLLGCSPALLSTLIWTVSLGILWLLFGNLDFTCRRCWSTHLSEWQHIPPLH